MKNPPIDLPTWHYLSPCPRVEGTNAFYFPRAGFSRAAHSTAIQRPQSDGISAVRYLRPVLIIRFWLRGDGALLRSQGIRPIENDSPKFGETLGEREA
jgi:hypothetical protein